MYYSMNIEEKIRIEPGMLVMDMESAAKKVLRDNYERKIYKGVGFIISINDVNMNNQGIVVPGDPNLYYTVNFDALVFGLSVNEVFECEVKEIVEFGAFANMGPLDGLLHVSQIGGEKFYFDKKSRVLSSRGRKGIKKGDELLLKVSTVSMKQSPADTKVGLTMRSDGLGKTEWLEELKKAKKPEKKKE